MTRAYSGKRPSINFEVNVNVTGSLESLKRSFGNFVEKTVSDAIKRQIDPVTGETTPTFDSGLGGPVE